MRWLRTSVPLAMGALLVLVTACGSSPGVQASIGPSGGSLAMENPSVRFDVPAGALTTETVVSMRASTDPQSVLVTLEPAQLTLAKPGQLSVSLTRTQHISGVAELTVAGEQPIGVDTRVEDASGVSARLGLDHLTRRPVPAMRITTAVTAGKGTETMATMMTAITTVTVTAVTMTASTTTTSTTTAECRAMAA